MQRLLCLRLWQVLFISISVFSAISYAYEESGVRIRGAKTTDAFAVSKYGPITSQDTLWNIAIQIRPDPKFTVYQVMQAIFIKNPDAFNDNNINHIIDGKTLLLPSKLEIGRIDPLTAKQKSEQDDSNWNSNTSGQVAKKSTSRQQSVQKKDLDEAKTEINEKLQVFGNVQNQKLETIQNDVLDSIDGLQAILKENEGLSNKLNSFDSQLNAMQEEVAKGKEVEVQMNNANAMLQTLLDKAEAREQELLLAKQKTELEGQSFLSSPAFLIMSILLPISLLLGGAFWFFTRRNTSTSVNNSDTSVDVSSAPVDDIKVPEDEPLSLDDELSLDSELSLDEEFSLDDELSIDLSENIEGDDSDLFTDDLDSLSDDLLEDEVIHLDDEIDSLDDLDDLDDLEEISLDDDGEPLADGQLDQNSLDDLLLDASDIDETLEDIQEEKAELTDPDDIDALMDSMASGPSESTAEDAIVDVAENLDENTELTDPDDIDALMDSMTAAPAPAATPEPEEDNTELTDPDDIDALMDSMQADSVAVEPAEAEIEEDNTELSDPDDIDALMDSMQADSVAAEPAEAEIEEDNTELTDPDDIDALMESMKVDSMADAPTPAATPEAVVEEDNTELTDPDDIDALMDSLSTEPTPASTPEASVEEDNTELTDPDDIDALMDSMGIEPTPAATPEVEVEEDNTELSDPGDIDTGINDEVQGEETKENENKALIDNFSEEYITPFLATDFSDVLSLHQQDETESDKVDKSVEEEIFSESNIEEEEDVDDDIIQDISNDFDESTLANLLNDEKSSDEPIEIYPDFTDSNVLAELLSDTNSSAEEVTEANELDDIQELDNLDFDELLANIEEESSASTKDDFDLDEELDIGDDLTVESDSEQSVLDDVDDNEDDFVSVDSLLSDSLDANEIEPYKSTNIDVGLSEFPEFSMGANELDVDDEDDNGTAAKLDLAKVYIEIGDNENAEVILMDVVKVGDAQQQFEAQQMLDSMDI